MANTDKYHKDKYAPSYVPDEKYRPKPANPNKKVEKVWGFTVLSFLALLAIFCREVFGGLFIDSANFPRTVSVQCGCTVDMASL